ncbi:hypothetical protein TNIN_68761 [Trichonephila inaurata madagascariensis]|uniref:Uncharacterized protein n=1 Tax=Trichonephila inaurata madagascariensis TaxID=2747483 RepID=A0A8X7CI19_9ARAC|nr:hypothetical protein TNIN_68761 [Trichonephila inaurata madagascariensis]
MNIIEERIESSKVSGQVAERERRAEVDFELEKLKLQLEAQKVEFRMIHNLLRECEKNRRILELKTRLIKDLTGVEENSRSPDPTGLQGNHAKMQKFEENRKYLIGELTGLTPCPVQDCLHNTTVKTLRKRLAAGSVSKTAVLNLNNEKSEIKD